ncbi:MAG: hypothetical protein GTO45_13885 [Candidatus Aminicenantes bacterium]|nr:hypothetical protein [Candidatus Aminicenantes bacterium]NIM79862.1 hypothetical protein [Candidatus Aminicenantes bacterium]NIN19198.1 hypothetical protein [Candidatus Aminicenantes bacterium]NIN43103.1 hypothetical protein [Candidatus Aminicenantes bacterium]NIN85840.1 hypothetical protein [Candidatus Aminicenantes bacterium]
MRYGNVLFLSLILCGSIVINVSHLDAQQNNNDTRQKAAQESLDLLKQLPPPVLEKLGFETRQMINESSLGKPLQAYIIWLGSLKEFKQGDDPGGMLKDVDEFNYPVYACEMPISSVTIRKRKEKWAFAAIGGREILSAENARLKHSASNPIPPPSYFMVQIQAMSLTFLGYDSEGKMYLIPTHEHPDLENYEPYKPVLAEEVFIELKRFIEKYENLPALSSSSPLLTVGKEELAPGESTWLKITVKGLYRYKKLNKELPFRLQNKTPDIGSMEGGNTQTHIIRPGDIDSYGIYTMTRILTGKVPGKFYIRIDFE